MRAFFVALYRFFWRKCPLCGGDTDTFFDYDMQMPVIACRSETCRYHDAAP